MTLDGLYWRFINKHKKFFKSNPRLSMMTIMLEKMKISRKEELFFHADKFIKEHTD
jgi:deoxyribodipyrimidine photolyase-related protein